MGFVKAAVVGVSVVGLGLGIGASEAGAATGIEHFTVINTSTASTNISPPSWLSASGPIHRLGIDLPLTQSSDGKSGTDRFAFHNGSIIISHKSLHQSQTQDGPGCLFTFTQSGTYTVTSGTGAYAGAKGSGTFVVTFEGIGCPSSDPNAPALVASQTIKASGPLSF